MRLSKNVHGGLDVFVADRSEPCLLLSDGFGCHFLEDQLFLEQVEEHKAHGLCVLGVSGWKVGVVSLNDFVRDRVLISCGNLF